MNVSDWPLYRYRGYVERVIDGDTIVCLVDLGFHTHRIQHVRLARIDAPELRTDEGKRARETMIEMLSDFAAPVYVETIRDGVSFERVVGEVYTTQPDGGLLNVGDELVRLGHATAKG